MNIAHQEDIETIIESVRKTNKYASVSLDLIRTIVEQEVTKRRNIKEAIKSTKNKLHQIGAAYITQKINYSQVLQQFKKIMDSEKEDDLLQFSRQIISYHVSTQERLPILDEFYQKIFAQIPPVTSIIDIACGLNPLTIPWMKLNDNCNYYAYDIYEDMIDFVNNYLKIINIQGYAKVCNVIQKCPEEKVDVAFIFKTLPCLEQLDKKAGINLLKMINAKYLFVSFPVHSLGGKKKGMVNYYEANFREMIATTNYLIQKIEFSNELVFLITK